MMSRESITPLAIFWKWKSILIYCKIEPNHIGIKYKNLSKRKRIIIIKNEIINATIWFWEIVLLKIPIAEYAAPINISPIYPARMIPPSGEPSIARIITYTNVDKIAATNNTNDAKNLPSTIWVSVTGVVQRSSIVPERFSSAIVLIVIAGIKNIKINGTTEKIFLIVASFTKKRFVPKNQPVINKKNEIRMYATGE